MITRYKPRNGKIHFLGYPRMTSQWSDTCKPKRRLWNHLFNPTSMFILWLIWIHDGFSAYPSFWTQKCQLLAIKMWWLLRAGQWLILYHCNDVFSPIEALACQGMRLCYQCLYRDNWIALLESSAMRKGSFVRLYTVGSNRLLYIIHFQCAAVFGYRCLITASLYLEQRDSRL